MIEDANQKKIRYGIMCKDFVFTSWQAECIKNLIEISNTKPLVLILEDNFEDNISKTANNKRGVIKNTFENIKLLRSLSVLIKKSFTVIKRVKLFSVYRVIFVKPVVECPTDLSDLLTNVEIVRCKVTKKGKYSQYFHQEDIQKIENYKLDFVLKFGFGIIRGEILNVTKYGIWSYHHDDEEKYRGGPACFWEIFYDDPVSGAILQRLTERLDGGIVLKKGYFKTINYSFERNIDGVYTAAAKWPGYVVKDIIIDQADYFNKSPSKSQARIFKTPSNTQTILFLFILLKNKILHSYLNFKDVQWNIGIIKKPINEVAETNTTNEVQWYPIKKTNDFVLADPFGISKNENLYIFCEKINNNTNLGEIATIEYKNNLFSSPKKYFSPPIPHLSYPYIFEYQGDIYLIPESYTTGEISLFKALNFPNEWIKVTTIVKNAQNVGASEFVDASIFYYDNLWWLMYTDQNIGINSSLCIMFSKDLFGGWIPHPLNPVKQDIRSARSAGTPFIYKNILYRPSQDCSRKYGGKIIINKVVALTPKKFDEVPSSYIEPISPFCEGIHTISHVGKYTLIDGWRYTGNFTSFAQKMVKKILLKRL